MAAASKVNGLLQEDGVVKSPAMPARRALLPPLQLPFLSPHFDQPGKCGPDGSRLPPHCRGSPSSSRPASALREERSAVVDLLPALRATHRSAAEEGVGVPGARCLEAA